MLDRWFGRLPAMYVLKRCSDIIWFISPPFFLSACQLKLARHIKSFDWNVRHGVDTATLKMLIAILLNSPREAEPMQSLDFGNMVQPVISIALLDALLSLPADTFILSSCPGVESLPSTMFQSLVLPSNLLQPMFKGRLGILWSYFKFGCLADSDGVEYEIVCGNVGQGHKISAEIVHMGLLQVR